MKLGQVCETLSSNAHISHFSMVNCLLSDRHKGISQLFESLESTATLEELKLEGINLVDERIDHILTVINANKKVLAHFC